MIGLKDLPIEDINDEALGLGDYIDSLSEFIKTCQTPMTIALQGDWGSGKTSLMNMIQKNIYSDEINKQSYKIIWCNSWQYSQFHLQNEMSLLILQHIVNELKKDNIFAERAKDKFIQVSKSIGRVMFKVGMVALSQGAGSGEAAEYVGDAIKGGSANFATEIEELKTSLEKLIEARSDSRIVVFIDDLDRLLPEKAVEFLEVFKLFLDIKGCVYVLACDYHVISQGLKKKFGVGTNELKGKSFFDKIIQLPFTMPLGQYDTKRYYKKLLSDIGINFVDEDLEIYQKMGAYSIGFNPRGMKRLFNSLQLLKLVAEKKNIFGNEKNGATNSEKERIMFGVLCLQTSFESVYSYLQKNINEIDQELFEELKDSESIKKSDRLSFMKKELLEETGNNDDIIEKLAAFMRAFFKALQLKTDDDDNTLSELEIENLQRLISFSSVTSRDSSDVQELQSNVMGLGIRSNNRKMANKLLEDLNEKYRDSLKKLSTRFVIYQPRDTHEIFIRCPINLPEYNTSFNIEFGYSDIEFTLAIVGRKARDIMKDWFENKLLEYYPEQKREDIMTIEGDKGILAKLNKEEGEFETIKEYEEEYENQVNQMLDYFFNDLANYLSEGNDFSFNENLFKGASPKKLFILGQTFDVKTWRDALLQTLNIISDLKPEKFNSLANDFPKRINTDETKIRDPKKLKNGYFMEANLSADAIQKFCRESVGLTTEEWKVEI